MLWLGIKNPCGCFVVVVANWIQTAKRMFDVACTWNIYLEAVNVAQNFVQDFHLLISIALIIWRVKLCYVKFPQQGTKFNTLCSGESPSRLFLWKEIRKEQLRSGYVKRMNGGANGNVYVWVNDDLKHNAASVLSAAVGDETDSRGMYIVNSCHIHVKCRISHFRRLVLVAFSRRHLLDEQGPIKFH